MTAVPFPSRRRTPLRTARTFHSLKPPAAPGGASAPATHPVTRAAEALIATGTPPARAAFMADLALTLLTHIARTR